jgi:hypothetical protein
MSYSAALLTKRSQFSDTPADAAYAVGQIQFDIQNAGSEIFSEPQMHLIEAE